MNRPLVLLLAILALSSPARAEESFTPLFNGRDLAGWVNVNCAPETWAVREGVVTCTGKPTGAMRTERQYENFIFEAEWRHMKSGGNAGIFVWSSPLAAPGVPFLRSVEVQVLDLGYGNTDSHTTHGDVFPIHGSTMKPFGRSRGMRSFPSEERSKPSPEWNHYRVECNDGTVRLQVNGKEVSGGEACVWRKGYLGLESEGSPTEWRNVRIRELPSTNPTPEQTAPEAQGHRPLYTGLDLRGWKTATPERWTPNDWKLVLKDGPAGEAIYLEMLYGDCELIVDCQSPGKGAAPAVLLGSPSVKVPLEGLEPGKWGRFTVVIKGRDVVVQRDGRETHRSVLPEGAPSRRSLGLLDIGAAAEFANLYVRELP